MRSSRICPSACSPAGPPATFSASPLAGTPGASPPAPCIQARCVSGGAAALVGLWDYQAVPREHPAHRTGAIHGYLNASMLALLLASLLLRRESQSPADGRPRTAAVTLSGAA